jgi:hypothetical protein
MKYFYDTEFIEDGQTIDLISIGVVCEDGREFYAQNMECNLRRASEWVQTNVLAHLRDYDPATFSAVFEHNASPWKTRAQIRDGLRAFVGDDKPEWWGYYSAYDHVALCQLFGTMMDLPKGWPFYTRDLKQWCDALGNPQLPEQGKGEHHALADARWNRQAWEYLNALAVGEQTYPVRLYRRDAQPPP